MAVCQHVRSADYRGVPARCCTYVARTVVLYVLPLENSAKLSQGGSDPSERAQSSALPSGIRIGLDLLAVSQDMEL